jgi:outer membrane protein assembly factor BamB
MQGTIMSLLRNGTALLLFLVFLGAAGAQDWTRFRGPNGSGIGTAAIPVRWTEKDFLWKVKLPGVGHSSPVLWGERIFVTSGDESTGKRIVLCLAAADGKLLWTREFPAQRHRKHTDNSFASATPAVDARHVYTCWASPADYLVLALDHTGKEVWRIDLGPFKSGHGFGSSPIVFDDLLIVVNDQDGESFAVGLDAGTGKLRWKVERRCKATWATPCIRQHPGRAAELILTSYELGITSLDPGTGMRNWEIDVFSKGHVESPISSPIVAGDLVIGTCGWLGVRKEVIAVRPGKVGSKSEVVWQIDRAAPLTPTPLVKDDLLFLISDEGMATCASVQSGEVYWRERVPGSYYGSPICTGKHLYCINRDGEVIVFPATKQFELLARNPLGEPSHSTPAIAGGRMYLRTFSHLICVGPK